MANENIIKLSEGFGEGTIGDVLTLKDENTVGWQTPQGGGSTYTPGSMIQIDNDTINIKNNNCSATGNYAIAVGYETSAIGFASHAEGKATKAIGNYSHTEGGYTIANDQFMHAAGKYNATSADALFVIGNGTDSEHRSDAFIVYPNGQAGATDFITNGVSLSGMLALYDVLTARPLAGSYTLKCVDGVLTWESEVPTNAVSVNNEPAAVNNETFGIGD